MPDIVLVAGPPFAPSVWRDVSARLEYHGLHPRPLDLLAIEGLTPTVDGFAHALADHTSDGDIVMAWFTAVPVAMAAAALSPPAALVLANGPIRQVDPFTRTVSRFCRRANPLARTMLSARLAPKWMASSAVLRRAVVNPYVMDRDTVVAITAPCLDLPGAPGRVVQFLADLPRTVEHAQTVDVPTMLVWGDSDPLHPAWTADQATTWLPHCRHQAVPGGRLLHIVEHPWVIADAVASWVDDGLAQG